MGEARRARRCIAGNSTGPRTQDSCPDCAVIAAMARVCGCPQEPGDVRAQASAKARWISPTPRHGAVSIGLPSVHQVRCGWRVSGRRRLE